MALDKKAKEKVIKEHGINDKDTGSADVQIGLLTKEIDKLALHLKKHQKDQHSKRGLVKMVIKRKRLLAYLKKENEKRYASVIKKIGLKK